MIVIKQNDFNVHLNHNRRMSPLIAAHNLTEANLRHAHRMGGLAAPSLAITRTFFLPSQYGEITLVAPWSMADPRKGARLFAADIYSSRYPAVEREIDRNAMERLSKQLEPTCEALGISYHLSHNELVREGEDYLGRHLAVLKQFLDEQGVEAAPVWQQSFSVQRRQRLQAFGFAPYMQQEDVHALLSDSAFCSLAVAEYRDALQVAGRGPRGAKLLAELDTDVGFQRNVASELANALVKAYRLQAKPQIQESDTWWAWHQVLEAQGLQGAHRSHVESLLAGMTKSERIFTGFSSTGRRRYVPHTLESVVRVMKKALQGGENFNYGVGSVRAHYAPAIRSLSALEGLADRLISAEDFAVYKDALNKEFFALAEAVDPKMDTQRLADILVDAAKMGLPSSARVYGLKLDEAQQIALQDFIHRLRQAPTSYFEAKVLRPVRLDEFEAAVCPQDLSDEAAAILDSHQIPIVTYPKRDEDGRRAVVASLIVEDVDRERSGLERPVAGMV
jgi:hypothetical protein